MYYFVGDTHGKFKELNRTISSLSDKDSVVICGDFGYWRKELFGYGEGWLHDDIVNKNGVSIYFCDGNHEDHIELSKLVNRNGNKHPIRVNEYLYYCPRGSELITRTGTRILFVGGASSTDKMYRTAYRDWFPEEKITEEDIKHLNAGKEYDIVVSHTCPKMCLETMNNFVQVPYDFYDQSTYILQDVFEMYHPKLWVYGHWHIDVSYRMFGCRFVALNEFKIGSTSFILDI